MDLDSEVSSRYRRPREEKQCLSSSGEDDDVATVPEGRTERHDFAESVKRMNQSPDW